MIIIVIILIYIYIHMCYILSILLYCYRYHVNHVYAFSCAFEVEWDLDVLDPRCWVNGSKVDPVDR
jgi:hypothetical protein